MKSIQNNKNLHFVLLPIFLVYFFSFYSAAQFNLFRPTYMLSSWWIDRQIPFLGWTVLIYFTHYPLLITAWFLNLSQKAAKIFTPFFLCSGIAFVIYFIFPTTIIRPESYQGFWKGCYAILYALDKPNNCLPSLHVAMALWAGLSIHGSKKLKTIIWIWALLVCLSTLTTKQHLFVDVIAGVCLTFSVYIFLRYFQKKTAETTRPG